MARHPNKHHHNNLVPAQPPLQPKPGQMGMQGVQIQAMLHQGPLPPPDILLAYNAAVPGAAQRIIAMAEDQNRHRMALETTVIPNREKNAARGQHYALVIALAAISAAVYCARINQPMIGTAVVGPTLCGLIYAFITGKQKQEKELEQKRPR